MPEPVVFIVDDHPGVRDSISELLSSVGLRHATFESAQQFAAAQGRRGLASPTPSYELDQRLWHLSSLQIIEPVDNHIAL